MPVLAVAAIAAAGAAVSASASSGRSRYRDYGDEMKDTLEDQIRLAPDLYAAEEEYRPRYADLDLQIARDNLLGRNGQPGMLQTLEDIQPTVNELASQ